MSHRLNTESDIITAMNLQSQITVDWLMSRAKLIGDCMIWAKAKNNKGYGVFGLKNPKKNYLAHRAIYFLLNGEIGKKEIMHKCDNPACINPNHLICGTHKENMQDMTRKKRNNPTMHGRRGEAHYRAKLKESDIIEIKNILKRNDSFKQRNPLRISHKAIGNNYGVCESEITNIKAGRIWGWVSV